MESYSRIETEEDYKNFHHDIEIRPTIWDHTKPDSRKAKQKAWTELSRIYSIKNFDGLTPVEKKHLKNDLQMKWKHSRLAFAREYSKWYNKGGILQNLDKAKKYKNGSKKTKFIHHLLFLIPSFEKLEWDGKYESDVKKKKKNDSDDEEENESVQGSTVFVQSSDHQHYVRHYIIPPVLQNVTPNVNVAPQVVQDVTQNMEEDEQNVDGEIIVESKPNLSSRENSQQQNSAPEDPFGSINDVNSLIDDVSSPRDEDEMFLFSLVSHLKDVPRQKKLIARCEIMQVLLKYAEDKS